MGNLQKWPIWGAIFLCLLFCAFMVRSKGLDTKQTHQTLSILNWPGYLDPQLVEKFEHQHNVTVSQVYYESDEHRTQVLLDNQAQGFDIILCSGFNLQAYANKGWIAPLNLALVPNRKHIDPKWLSAFPTAVRFAIPYAWGTTGILYRHDLITKQIDSWHDFFNPDPSLKGKLGMVSDGNEAISLALKALGYSINEGGLEALQRVDDLLAAQQPFIRSYQYMNSEGYRDLLEGNLWMTLAYNGDALMVMARDKANSLTFTVPNEGTNLWVDYLTIGADTNNVVLAHQFINFMSAPENAAQAALYTFSATPNKSALRYMPTSYLTNPIIFPANDVLEKSELFKPIPSEQLRRRYLISGKWVSRGQYAPD